MADGEEFLDPYLDPTGILRNLTGARTKKSLEDADGNHRGPDRVHFIDRFVYHYDQVNYIHPFRAGNGSVQRVFWNRVALAAGWQLD